MAQKNMTIETLAEILNETFETTASMRDVAALHAEMNQKFEAVESRLDRIETLCQR